jgi:type IV pilus assembly protein PilO
MALPEFFDPIVNLPKGAKLGLGFGGVAVIAAAVYFLLVSPIQDRTAKLETDLKTVQQEVQQNKAILASLETFKRQAVELEKQLSLLTLKLPTEKEMPPLYRTVSDMAFQSGLAVALFQPRDPQVREFYSQIPITITAEGGYHELATFFDRLSGLARVVNVDQWKLTGISRSKQPLRADVTLATYMYRPVGAPAVPKPGAKK